MSDEPVNPFRVSEGGLQPDPSRPSGRDSSNWPYRKFEVGECLQFIFKTVRNHAKGLFGMFLLVNGPSILFILGTTITMISLASSNGDHWLIKLFLEMNLEELLKNRETLTYAGIGYFFFFILFMAYYLFSNLVLYFYIDSTVENPGGFQFSRAATESVRLIP